MNLRSQAENPISTALQTAATREQRIRSAPRTSAATSRDHPDRLPA
jgi:hypothetical protein